MRLIKILIFFALAISVVFYLAKKIIPVTRSGTYPSHTQTFNHDNQKISYTSFYEHITTSQNFHNYCQDTLKEDYIPPVITITDTTTNKEDNFTLVPDFQHKIYLNGGYSLNNFVVIKQIDFDFTNNCQNGPGINYLFIDKTGQISNLNITSFNSKKNISLIKNGQLIDQKLTTLFHTSISDSDFNRDQLSDTLVVQKTNSVPPSWSVIIINTETNQPANWFNHGQPLSTSENIDQATNTYSKTRDFLKKYASVWNE